MLDPRVTVWGSPWKLLWNFRVVPAATLSLSGKYAIDSKLKSSDVLSTCTVTVPALSLEPLLAFVSFLSSLPHAANNSADTATNATNRIVLVMVPPLPRRRGSRVGARMSRVSTRFSSGAKAEGATVDDGATEGSHRLAQLGARVLAEGGPRRQRQL